MADTHTGQRGGPMGAWEAAKGTMPLGSDYATFEKGYIAGFACLEQERDSLRARLKAMQPHCRCNAGGMCGCVWDESACAWVCGTGEGQVAALPSPCAGDGPGGLSGSITRMNLMECPGYAPYCGAVDACRTMPRTKFNGEQFTCPACSWVSAFPPDFIEKYKERWGIPEGGVH